MKVTVRLSLAMLIVAPASLAAQTPARLAFDSAAYAWEGGRYPEALQRLERLLTGPSRDTLLAPIALLTGELYRTRELAPDASDPRWSPDGALLAYEIGGDSARRSVLVNPNQATVRPDTLPGYAAIFAPDGSEVAYLSTQRPAVVFRSLRGAGERTVDIPGLVGLALVYPGATGPPYLVATADPSSQAAELHAIDSGAPRPIAGGGRLASLPVRAAGGRLVFATADASIAIRAPDGTTTVHRGTSPVVSADGSTLAFVQQEGSQWMLLHGRIGAEPRVLVRSLRPLAAPALAPDGSRLVYQTMPREDWELYVVGADGGEPRRLTHEIQHDIYPQFVSRGRVLAVMGEGRHRRSYLYDAASGARTRLFHNNTVRTIAPEYEWVPRPDGEVIAIVSERDGDTVSPERGLYVTDLRRTVTASEVLGRVRDMARAERDLRQRGTAMFAPVAAQVRPRVAEVSSARIYDYARTLFTFGSKHATQPGNGLAVEYLDATLRSFGYEPELQWFEPAPGVRSANVVATLRGTTDPEVQYVVGSHFDSVKEGPGADDNTSGTTALLEVARVLARRPQAATIKFVWFTAEESGLRGSREFVRRATEAGDRIVGALNNDMLGWTNNDRLDNTVRYANTGLRDLQHAAAFLFSDLITYDAHYYKFTDAHSLVDGFGDVVSGIGSYPVLGNPHYHQPHDVLETVNHRLVAEVARTTLASAMLMASSPSRLTGLTATRGADGSVEVRWSPAVERGVTGYRIGWEDEEGNLTGMRVVRGTAAKLTGVPQEATIVARAVGAKGLEGWDWARAPLED
ncbi:MAG TPA: M20/M25/M40 family metallo-hydrolase [Gemmatimonadales bacterium]|nr:M20/M25/M40 family metallo-hydrolase [Gemmatimonadales bacterium]